MGAERVHAAPQPDGSPGQFYRALAETIPHMVWSAWPDGHHDYHNRRFHAYAGLAPAALAGWGWQAIVHPDDLQRCRARWQDALVRAARFEVEYRLKRHDGAYLWHLGTAEPLRADGRIVRWFGTCTDTESRKKADRMLEQARRSLEAMVESRSEALAASQRDLLGSLSSRERQALRHMVEGRTIAQTAEKLGVSPKSVKTYRSRVMSKLGVFDLPGLVKFAIRNGVTTIC